MASGLRQDLNRIQLPVGTAGTVLGYNLTNQPALIGNFTGATGGADGAFGTVPKPLLGQQNYVLRGSGVWGPESGGGGSGTVTSVALAVPSFLSITGSPITTSGTFTIGLSGTALPRANGGTGITTTGTALQQLRVNAGGTALEYFTPSGGGITSLGGLTGATQTFGNDTNVTVVSSGSAHTLTWAGTLADARISSAATWNAKIGGSGTSGQIAYFTASGTIASEAGFEYNPTTNVFTAGSVHAGASSTYLSLDSNNIIKVDAFGSILTILGATPTSGEGGQLHIRSGNAGSGGSADGNILIEAGTSGGVINRGRLSIRSIYMDLDASGLAAYRFIGVNGNVSSNNGTGVSILGGNGYTSSGNGNGGSILIQSGFKRAAGSGTDGNITIDSLNGYLIISTIPTSSAGLPSGAVWANANVLTIVP